MKVVVQSYRTGEVSVVDVPPPQGRPGSVLVRTVASAVSAGTEKLMMEFARRSLFGKALARPDLLQAVVNRVRTEGVADAYRHAMSRLERPTPLGYSAAGVVIAGADSAETKLRVGDRVACTGAGYACHAEILSVPLNLVNRLPDGVDWESAAFAGLGAIALHGARKAGVELGARVVVVGLGVLGLLAVQVLRAGGAAVFGVDLDPERVELACRLGAETGACLVRDDPLSMIQVFTGGRGADAVLIAAAAKDDEPLKIAAAAARERGRIVALGMVGLRVPRRLFYSKELELVVPRSSGPGLYDPGYERQGRDYPYSYVRWSHGRNVEEFLRLIARGAISLKELITHRFPIEKALQAYELLDGRGREARLGIVLTYEEEEPPRGRYLLAPLRAASRHGRIGVGVIGAGMFANATLLPLLARQRDLDLMRVVTASGITATYAAKRYGFAEAASDPGRVLDDPEISAVFILTRHDKHAELAAEALERGKWVFVEKPLAIDNRGLRRILRALHSGWHQLFVGFNRRYSPMTVLARDFLAASADPVVVHCRVNAGRLDPDSWVFDDREGGGRIRGEVCHFVDLTALLAGDRPESVYAECMAQAHAVEDVAVTLRFANGSVGTILYTSAGDKAFPRERIEAFSGGRVAVIDNFRRLDLVRNGRRFKKRRFSSSRGYAEELDAFFSAVRGLVPFPGTRAEEAVLVTAATFAIDEALRRRAPVAVNDVLREVVEGPCDF